MSQSKIDFKKLRAEISFKYGIELDETSLTILAILTLQLNNQFLKMDRAQEEMISQIQLSKKALQVDTRHPRWQAFWHGMGQWGLGLCLAVIVAFVFFSIDRGWEKKEQELLRQELAAYRAYYQEHEQAKRNAGNGSKGEQRRKK